MYGWKTYHVIWMMFFSLIYFNKLSLLVSQKKKKKEKKKQNKPTLNRHVKARIKQIKHIKQELKQGEKKRWS